MITRSSLSQRKIFQKQLEELHEYILALPYGTLLFFLIITSYKEIRYQLRLIVNYYNDKQTPCLDSALI